MSQLNRGKQNVGSVTYLSSGTQSPAVDAVPLAWNVGDRRRNFNSDFTLIGWVCTAAGTPGTWVEVRIGNTVDLALSYGNQSGDGALPTPPEATAHFFLRPNTDKTVIQSVAGSPGSIWEYEVGPGINLPAGRVSLDLFVYSCALTTSGGPTSLTMQPSRNGALIGAATVNLDGTTNTRIITAPGGPAIATGDRLGIFVDTTNVGSGFLMATAHLRAV